jgi:hypothetical protein
MESAEKVDLDLGSFGLENKRKRSQICSDDIMPTSLVLVI